MGRWEWASCAGVPIKFPQHSRPNCGGGAHAPKSHAPSLTPQVSRAKSREHASQHGAAFGARGGAGFASARSDFAATQTALAGVRFAGARLASARLAGCPPPRLRLGGMRARLASCRALAAFERVAADIAQK